MVTEASATVYSLFDCPPVRHHSQTMDRVALEKNRKALERMAKRLSFLWRIRPQALAGALVQVSGLNNHRAIVRHEDIYLYISPLSYTGHQVLLAGGYEPEYFALFRSILRPGSTFLDIGANEGVFSALATKVVGPNGLVIAVEPQQRMHDILEINLALNGSANHRAYCKAVSDRTGDTIELSLYPILMPGTSSTVQRYRWGTRSCMVETITVDALLKENDCKTVDLMKVDVEGAEYEVIQSAMKSLENGTIKVIALDYHYSTLRDRGIDPDVIHKSIVERGYSFERPNADDGYVQYTRTRDI